MKKIIGLLLSLALFFSCSNLVKKLPKDIRDWYDIHSIWMESKVPTWIVDGNYSEKYCFLRMPEKAQRMYMNVFWKVRKEGLAEGFYEQIESANAQFTGEGRPGWKTDRGRVLVVCGFPQFRQVITVSELEFIWTSNPMNRGKLFVPPLYDTDGTVYIFWDYYLRRVGAKFMFKYSHTGYKAHYSNLSLLSFQTDLIRSRKKLYTPTPDGWGLIGGWVLDWVRDRGK